jgi:uncharacterized protein
MNPETQMAMSACLFGIAFLYSSVGHAGASGYIAIMVLFEMAPAVVRPLALILNIVVALIASYQFFQAGHFSFNLYWKFAILAVPFSFLGGYLNLPAAYFKMVVGSVLILSAIRFILGQQADNDIRKIPTPLAMGIGGGLGLLSGLTGTGGGIFLTPLLLIGRWALTKNAAAVSAVFILTNSISGLLGNWSNTRSIPSASLFFVPAVLLGGSFGSYLGARKFNPTTIKRLLALVLLIAGAKLIWTG